MVCSVWGWGGDRERRPEKPRAASTRTRTTAGARRVRRMPEAEGGALASEGGGDGSRGLRRSRLRGGISPAVGPVGRRGGVSSLP